MNSVRSILTPMRVAALTIGVLLLATAVLAGQLAGTSTSNMTWTTVDGGGGVSSGTAGAITLQISGTIGQHDGFITMTDGNALEFSPGFWRGVSSHHIDCPSDIYPTPLGDNVVNVDDMLLVITTWGPGGAGDATHDGMVNIDDLLEVVIEWGACP